MTSWKKDFESYETAVEGKRAIVAVDLGANGHAPLATHPHRFIIGTRMVRARPDGLRSEVEAPALFDLEDALVASLALHGFVYVGRGLHDGWTRFVFYAPARFEDCELEKAVGDHSPYTLDFDYAHDPEWESYRDFLWPDDYAMQSIANRRLMLDRTKLLDRPEVIREVDHLAFFPDEMRARQAAAALAKRHFRVDPPRVERARGPKRWAVEFHRDDRLDGNRPDEITTEILDIVLPLDGDYDGWGALIKQ